MSVLLQMGNDSRNLVAQHCIHSYSGIVLSPVNETLAKTKAITEEARGASDIEIVFDPQLYVPRSKRGQLTKWEYFPTDVETADQSNIEWWASLCSRLLQDLGKISVDTVCSPMVIPRRFTNDYYELTERVGSLLAVHNGLGKFRVLQTAIISSADIAAESRALEIASILSRTKASGVYLVVHGEEDVRREVEDIDQLTGTLRLISSLEDSGIPVMMGFSSSDMLLWKAAGASRSATGKFFNLRRFTPSRFEERAGGGGQLPYWFEPNLMAFLRESDLVRLRDKNILEGWITDNPYSHEILATLNRGKGEAWLAASWKQYLYEIAKLEGLIERKQIDPDDHLKHAENNWLLLQDKKILMEEPRNDGRWLRPWRRALAEF